MTKSRENQARAQNIASPGKQLMEYPSDHIQQHLTELGWFLVAENYFSKILQGNKSTI